MEPYIKKNALILVGKDSMDPQSMQTKNPIDDLGITPTESLSSGLETTPNYSKQKMVLGLIVAVLMVISFAFNGFFSRNIDPMLAKIFSGNKVMDGLTLVPSNLIKKPYMLTIGEFENQGIAKEKAIELLPKLKQIDIMQLESGMFTFQIKNFSFESSAHRLAQSLEKQGIQGVKIRRIN